MGDFSPMINIVFVAYLSECASRNVTFTPNRAANMKYDLDEKTIIKLPVPPEPMGPRDYPDSGVRGLVITRRPNGGSSWNFRYRIGFGKNRTQRRLTLGTWPEMGIDEARELAIRARKMLKDGVDPADWKAERHREQAEQQQALAERSYVRLAETFILSQRRLQRKSWTEQARILGFRVREPKDGGQPVFKIIEGGLAEKWRDRPITQIARIDVSTAVNEMLHADLPSAARLRLAALKTLFSWLVSEGYIDFSPADKYKLKIQTIARERVLTDDEIRLFWHATEAEPAPFKQFLRTLLLTAQRRNEVAGMRYEEINGDVWTIPAKRSKNGRAHRVPLSPAAVSLIKEMPQHASGPIFTTTGETAISGFSKVKARVEARMAELGGRKIPQFGLHDLRRTAASGMAELGVLPHVVEQVLNHQSGTFAGVAGVYNRFDYLAEKRDALERWAERVAEIAGDK